MASSVLLTNISAFVESAARQVTTAIAQLDRLTDIAVGPDRLAPFYIPAYGANHPDYGLMYFVNSSRRDIGAGLVEVTRNYAGRMNTGGSSNFVSERLTSFSESEKEISYQRFFQVRVNQVFSSSITTSVGTTPLASVYLWKLGTDSRVHRYITRDVTYKYVCSFKPLTPNFNGSETAIVSKYDRWAGRGNADFVSGSAISPDPGPVAWWQSNLNAPLGYSGPFKRCTQFTANQVIGAWYECEETWELRYEIASTNNLGLT